MCVFILPCLQTLCTLFFAVCEKSEVKNALRVKEKLDFIVGRASALEKELREKRISATGVPDISGQVKGHHFLPTVNTLPQEAVNTGKVCQPIMSDSHDCSVLVS